MKFKLHRNTRWNRFQKCIDFLDDGKLQSRGHPFEAGLKCQGEQKPHKEAPFPEEASWTETIIADYLLRQ